MTYLLLFFSQGLNFLIAVISIQAAGGRIKWTVLSSFVFSLVNFALIAHIAKANDDREMLAYAAGSVVGLAIAILVTKSWDKQ